MSQECITDQVTGGAAMYFHFFKNVSEMSGRTFLEQKLFLSINILRKKLNMFRFLTKNSCFLCIDF